MTNEKQLEEQTIAILQGFKLLNPWNGMVGARMDKFNLCFKQLKKLYDKKDLKLTFFISSQIKNWSDSGCSYYNRNSDEIVLHGRLSVLTFLHEFAHALFGSSEKKAREWSINLFKKVWPEKFANLQTDNDIVWRTKK